METPHQTAILRAEAIENTIDNIERAVEDLRMAERAIWQALQDNRTAQNVLIDRRSALNADLDAVYVEMDFYADQERQQIDQTLDRMAAEESWTSVETSV